VAPASGLGVHVVEHAGQLHAGRGGERARAVALDGDHLGAQRRLDEPGVARVDGQRGLVGEVRVGGPLLRWQGGAEEQRQRGQRHHAHDRVNDEGMSGKPVDCVHTI
jgi:hypothetical protein